MSGDFSNRSRGWRTSLGFYLAVLCSSFGLMNIWRFPYVTIENGGGAFIYLYFFLAALMGSGFVMSELLIGKIAQQSVWVSVEKWYREKIALSSQMSGIEKLFYKILRRSGDGAMVATFLVMAYYTVISGWVLSFMAQFAMASWQKTPLVDLENNLWLQLLFAAIHLVICYSYVRRGLRRGIERMAYIVTPIFITLLIILCIQALELPQSEKALRFLLYPDFTKMNLSSLNQAIGHMVLSLGLGLGMMTTFGSYFQPQSDVTSSGPKVVMFSMLASLMSVLIICPMVLGATFAVFGPRLLFQTLPQFIMTFPEGGFFLVTFYGALYISSLVASTSVLESLVANICDRWQWQRISSLRLSSGVVLSLCLFPIASTTWWRHYRWMGGVSLLQTMDGILVNYLLPLLALGLSLVAIFLVPKKYVQREFLSRDIDHTGENLFPIWKTVVLWVAPIVIGLAFVMRLIALF